MKWSVLPLAGNHRKANVNGAQSKHLSKRFKLLKLWFELVQNGNCDGFTLVGFQKLGAQALGSIVGILEQQSLL